MFRDGGTGGEETTGGGVSLLPPHETMNTELIINEYINFMFRIKKITESLSSTELILDFNMLI